MKVYAAINSLTKVLIGYVRTKEDIIPEGKDSLTLPTFARYTGCNDNKKIPSVILLKNGKASQEYDETKFTETDIKKEVYYYVEFNDELVEILTDVSEQEQLYQKIEDLDALPVIKSFLKIFSLKSNQSLYNNTFANLFLKTVGLKPFNKIKVSDVVVVDKKLFIVADRTEEFLDLVNLLETEDESHKAPIRYFSEDILRVAHLSIEEEVTVEETIDEITTAVKSNS